MLCRAVMARVGEIRKAVPLTYDPSKQIFLQVKRPMQLYGSVSSLGLRV